jgi:putative transposase
VYNRFLAKQIERHKAGEGYLGLFDTAKELPELKRTEGYEWLKEADSASLSYALCDLDNAYKAFFRNVRKGDVSPGFPKFKSKKGGRQSFRTKNRQPSPGKISASIELNGNSIKLPKLGRVKCRASRKTEGRIISATVLQNPSGNYYVSVCCTDVAPTRLPKTGKTAGLHLGIRELAVTSDGRRFENPAHLEKSQKKLSRLHRALSRKQSEGSNREKARRRYAKACERVKNRREDTHHKLTTRLVRDYDIIAVQDASVREMLQKHAISRRLADTGRGELVRQLSYKCEWYGKTLIKVDGRFPSAQLCSDCGFKNVDVRRRGDLREWDCKNCGAHLDRGVNAAINLLNEALRMSRPDRLGAPRRRTSPDGGFRKTAAGDVIQPGL